MEKTTDRIKYFGERTVYNAQKLRFTCFKMASQMIMIAGTRNGEIIGFYLETNFTAKILIDQQRPLRSAIQRIECLGDSYNLLLFSEQTLYYYNLESKKLKEIERYVSSFDLQVQDNEVFLYLAQKTKVLKFGLNVANLKDDKHWKPILLKEYFFKNNIKQCFILKNSLVAYLTSNEVLFTDLKKLSVRDSNLPRSDYTQLVKISNTEMLALVNYEKGSTVGIFLNEKGASQQNRNTVNLECNERVTRAVCSGQFLVISVQNNRHFVFELNSIQLVQMLGGDNPKDPLLFGFYQNELYALTEHLVSMYSRMNPKEIVKVAKKDSGFRLGTALLRTLGEEIGADTTDEFVKELYFYCAWDLTAKQKYIEATECFNHIEYDPLEIIETFIGQYSLDGRFEFIAYTNQLKRFVKNLFNKKRTSLLNSKMTVIETHNVMRKNMIL